LRCKAHRYCKKHDPSDGKNIFCFFDLALDIIHTAANFYLLNSPPLQKATLGVLLPHHAFRWGEWCFFPFLNRTPLGSPKKIVDVLAKSAVQKAGQSKHDCARWLIAS
jgi:hypothetical protein